MYTICLTMMRTSIGVTGLVSSRVCAGTSPARTQTLTGNQEYLPGGKTHTPRW